MPRPFDAPTSTRLTTSPAGPTPAAPPPPLGPPLPPPQPTQRARRSASWPQRPAWVLGAVVLLAIATEQVRQATSVGLLLTLVLAGGAAMVAALHQRVSRWEVMTLALAILASSVLAIRQSPVVLVLTTITTICLLIAAALSDGAGPSSLLSASGRTLTALVDGLRWLAVPLAKRVAPHTGAMLVRSVAVLTLIGSVLGLTLAAADPVFASAVTGVQGGRSLGWLMRVAAFAVPISALALLSTDSSDERPVPADVTRPLRVDGLVGMLAIVVVLGTWCATQVVVAAGGAQHVLWSAGLTRAEYARSGFFQLVFTTALVLALIFGLDRLTDSTSHDRWFARAGGIVACETLILVAATGRRMMLYVEAFGLTLTRLVVLWFLIWLALVVVATSAGIVQRRLRSSSILSPAAVARFAFSSAAVMVIVFGWWNPEAQIVEVNVGRAETGEMIDPTYLAGMSPDGLNALATAVESGRVDEAVATAVLPAICSDPGAPPWWNLNWSRRQLLERQSALEC